MIARRSLTALLATAACFAWVARPAFSAENAPIASGPVPATQATSESRSPAGNPAAAPQSAPGQRVHIDPQTGRFLKEPPAGRPPLSLSPQTRNAMSTSHEGLAEEPSTVPGGGYKLDLKGRFRSPLFATIDADGKVRTRHLDEAPATEHGK